MTNYQAIMRNLPTITKLVKSELLSRTVIVYVAVYDNFYQLEGPKMKRYQAVGDEFNMSSKNVQRIILLMNKEI